MTSLAIPPLTINSNNFPWYSSANLDGKLKHEIFPIYKEYAVEESKGINFNSNLDKEDRFLAINAVRVANYMKTLGNCYTGVKHAFWTSGIIDNYADMPRGSAHKALKYFKENPQKFEKITKKDGTTFTTKDLQSLPAGYIIVYTKESAHGHISITSGHKQGISDTFDNMKWLDEKGKGAKADVFKLTDGWKYDPKTAKLKFHQPK